MITTQLDDPRPGNRTDPIILRQCIDDDEARFSLQIPDDLVYFEGHFPGRPILPGVIQIKWVMDLAERLPLSGSLSENFSVMTKLKFMRLITRGDQLTLHLTTSSSGKLLSFRFFDDEGDYSSGQLRFK